MSAMSRGIPDFFHPVLKEENGSVSVDFTTWDKEGQDVQVRLGARIPDGADRTAFITALTMSAWQSVWLAAQKTATELQQESAK